MLSDSQILQYQAELKQQQSLEEHTKEIGENLKAAREKEGLTQAEVAAILNWPEDRKVRRIENGETKCSLEILFTFCKIYHCFFDEIFPKDERPYITAMFRLAPTALKDLNRTLVNAMEVTA